MAAAQSRLDIATGNLANVSTAGFQKVVARGVLSARGVRVLQTISPAHGPLYRTGRAYDLAIAGGGAFRLRDERGTVSLTRDGAFTRARDGTLRDDAGRMLLGLHGVLHVPHGASIDERGRVVLAGRHLDAIPIAREATLHAGYLEAANVSAIDEMVDVLTAQRSFESAEKVVAAIDGTRQKSSNDVARIK